MQKIYNYITEELGPSSFIRGLNYNSSYIRLLKTEVRGNEKDLYFKVKSERTEKYYNVWINTNIENETIDDYECDCPQFRNYYSCKHIAASALKYEEELYKDEDYNDITYELNVSSQIIDRFYIPKTNVIKKKLNLEITIEDSYDYYHGDYLTIKYKIGLDKLYTLKGKYNGFKYSYKNNDEYRLTPKFIYDPNTQYFEKSDKKIIDFTDEFGGSSDNQGDMIFKNNIDAFIKLLKEKYFYIRSRQYYSFYEENPFEFNLSKKDDIYILKIDNIKEFKPLIDDSRYVYNDDKLYKLSNDITKLYYLLYKNELDKIVFKKDNLSKFVSGILPFIKEEVKIEAVPEIIITKAPNAKLYFDFRYNDIECKVKLKYGKEEIDYFDSPEGIVRDTIYESNIIENLRELDFQIYENELLLTDVDSIGYFLEEGIFKLSENYEVFTSEKIKNTNIIKKSNNSLSFSIGKDNILSYNFNLDGIKKNELLDILTALRNRKKYHKLKNGDILNLEKDPTIRQLNELTEELGLSNKEIDEGEGTIPKYRAIYLDSLRSGYNGIISTNNEFDELIKNFHEYKDKDITLESKKIKILRDYQKTGVKWLYNIYKTGFGGILADEMGLGKSIQLIYLIKLIIKENPKAKILIVSPTSLIYNWEKEFDKFAKELNYKVFAENKNQRINNLEKDKKTNIFITSYGLVRNDVEQYEKMHFELIAIDEAQNIKNPQAGITKSVKKINSNTKIALTGTPLENNVMELWSIFDFIMPGYLASQKKFGSLYNVKDMKEESIKPLERLNKQIKYFILRRKKKDVVNDLPDKIDNNIYIDLNKKQKEIYAAEVQKTQEEMDDMIKAEGFEGARFKILQILTRLRQICIDPSLVFENYKGESSKIEELLKIIGEAKENGHKILLFSSYKKALDKIIPKLNNLGISSYYISGDVSAKKRMELVENFNKDDTDVFMITLKAGGTGLNLTSATVVIHLDLWWNPQVENQATDRAHRIGQKNTVEVIRIISKGTIEERILELQNKKRKLAELLIEGDNNQNEFSKLTEKDIKMLLSMDNREK